MALSWTDLGLILAASLWMAVPFLLALCLCVLVEMLFPSEELSLRERLPGALFVLALPVSAAFIVPPFHAFWRFVECPILIDLRWMPDWLLLAMLLGFRIGEAAHPGPSNGLFSHFDDPDADIPDL